jgi:hypothetical protein
VTNEILSAYSADEFFNLNENGFKLAFGVVNFWDNENLGDLKKVQWEVDLRVRLENKKVSEYKLKFGPCTDEDYADFFPIVARNAAYLKTLKENKLLNCIDRD